MGPDVLLGRQTECAKLDELLAAVRSGWSRALVVHGAPGVGKTALLEYAATRAAGCRVLRVTGVKAEQELSFAGLHQVCLPMLGLLGRLPGPQREALRSAFGLVAGCAPERFLVGLAIRGLLAEAAVSEPLVCLIDDLQWLDRDSTEALTIAARRLDAESVALIFATREPRRDLGLPELVVSGLAPAEARALLEAVLPGPVDERVADQLVAESEGNPLALLELPRSLTPGELAGGFGLPGTLPDRIEEGFQLRIAGLAEPSHRLLLLAAADPVGDPVLLWRAADALGVSADAASPAAATGLIEFGVRVRFRHPLVRSAVYRDAPHAERQRVHRALAEASDPVTDPDRRAWHLARASTGPDEQVAAELVASASRAKARGGFPAAAAFLARAVELTRDPGLRATRALAAAQAALDGGAPSSALELVAVAQTGRLDDRQHADLGLVQAEIAFAVDRGTDATMMLLKAAQELGPLDARAARDTYLQALSAWRLTRSNAVDVAEAVRLAPPPAGKRRPADLLMEALAARAVGDLAFGTHLLRRGLRAVRDQDGEADEQLRWLWPASTIAPGVWDERIWHDVARRHVDLARSAGALTSLPLALTSLAAVRVLEGELTEAAELVRQVAVVTEATGTRLAPYGAVLVAAWRGREDEVAALAADQEEQASRGEGGAVEIHAWARALLGNSLGRYADVVAATEMSMTEPPVVGTGLWMLTERVEAAACSGLPGVAEAAFRWLHTYTLISGTDWALGIEARCRALLSAGTEVDYQEAIERLGRTRVRGELARAHLLYGEWLHRRGRRLDAREQLRTAHEMFAATGMAAFARRAEHELQAAGATVRHRATEGGVELTTQEAQVAWLAQEGLSNSEIGARLFLSPRTVEWHLGKIFGKLGVTSRRQLRMYPRLPHAGARGSPGGKSRG